MSIAVMSDWELHLLIFTLVTARTRCSARCVGYVNGSGFSYRLGRHRGSSASLRRARAVPPCCLPALPFSLPARRCRQLDLKHLKYKALFAINGWFFGLDLKFLPESREGREVRETRPGPPRLASRRRAAPRANGKRRGGRGEPRGSRAPPSSSGRRRRGSGCGSGSPGAG
jgi:hypothetical protein